MTNQEKYFNTIFSYVDGVNLKGKTGICLNMIVKNETAVLERLFQSVSQVIDYFVIVDTGSTDGTPEFILELAQRFGLPGEVHFRDWVNFGHNRQQALELAVAAAKGRWLLFIDADEELKYLDHAVFKKLKPRVTYKLQKHHNSIRYALSNLIDISENRWHWRGVVHEYIEHLDGPNVQAPLEGAWIHFHAGQGARSHGLTQREKFLRDASLLAAELERNPDDARSRFYLAQSYRDAGELKKAIEHYAMRVQMGGWQEEVFYSLYQIGRLKEQLGHPDEEVLATYAAATSAQPKRAEAIHAAARFCRIKKLHKKGYEISKEATSMQEPEGALFSEYEVYTKGLLDEFSINAYWAGHYDESLEACLKLICSDKLEHAELTRIAANAEFARKKLIDASLLRPIQN